jgi:lysophospholipase L1-like esterase
MGKNLILLSITVVMCILLAELVLRSLGYGRDFLGVTLMEDARYGHRLGANAVTDEWGFRNATVPRSAEIAAIGDSQTYGVSANAEGSWPAQLSQRTNRSAYNLGVGGYGPVQYDRLWDDFVPRLNAPTVIIALYLGNDIRDAFAYAALLDTGDPLRPAAPPPLPLVAEKEPDGWLASLRVFLFTHSVLYNVTKAAFPQLADNLKDYLRKADLEKNDGRGLVPLGASSLSFDPEMRLEVLRLDRADNVEGLRLTTGLVERLAGKCQTTGRRCLLAIIPTKEAVYEGLLRDVGIMDSAFLALWDAERTVRRTLLLTARDYGLQTIDPLAAMTDAARRETIYPAFDGHPNSRGYKVIAGEIAAALDLPPPPK